MGTLDSNIDLTEHLVTQMINTKIHQYINGDDICTVEDINNGLCGRFAEEVVSSLGGIITDKLDVCSCEDFMLYDEDYNYTWDVVSIERNWENIKPIHGLSWRDINEIDLCGSHEWIYFDGKHYDAECSNGVGNIFELPIFKRYIEVYCIRVGKK